MGKIRTSCFGTKSKCKKKPRHWESLLRLLMLGCAEKHQAYSSDINKTKAIFLFCNLGRAKPLRHVYFIRTDNNFFIAFPHSEWPPDSPGMLFGIRSNRLRGPRCTSTFFQCFFYANCRRCARRTIRRLRASILMCR